MKLLFVTFGFISVLTSHVNGQGNMCGVAAADPMKTCVSLRLPWQAEPIYFCMEKEKFRYRNKCSNSHMMNCGGSEMRNDTLLLATPWDCSCPYTSVPDHCMHSQCSPMPLNRKCVIVDESMTMDNSWDCCPKYFCEEGTSPQNCHVKRLEPTCFNPPQGKMNCVGFYDPYGCCAKYQCDGDGGKPGLCPAQHQAMQQIMRYNSSYHMMMNMSMNNNNMMSAMPPPPPGREAKAMGSTKSKMSTTGERMKRQAMVMSTMSSFYPSSMQMECVGDSNCPGNMKCCSHDMNAYGDGRYVMKNMHTRGYCMEPVMMMPMQ